MNRRILWTILASAGIGGGVASSDSLAYEDTVHIGMTSNAFDQTPEFLSKLGIRPDQTFVGR